MIVVDLSSHNGTFVNGKRLTEPYTLTDRDLVGVGPLTFAVSIQGVPAMAGKSAKSSPTKKRSPNDFSHDEIEAWLAAEHANPTPDRPSGVSGGDTISISALRDAGASKSAEPAASKPTAPVASMSRALKSTEPAVPDSDDSPSSLSLDNMEFEQLPEGLGEAEAFEDLPEENKPAARPTQDFFNESNPFSAKPKGLPTPAKVEKKGSSDAAADILRRMMGRPKDPK